MLRTINLSTAKLHTLYSSSLASKRLVRGGVWALFATVLTGFLAVVIDGMIARLLTPNEMGVYVYILSIVLTATVVAQLGLGAVAIRMIAGSMGKQDFGTAYFVVRRTLMLTLLGVIIVLLAVGLGHRQIGIQRENLVLILAWIAILTWQKTLGSLLRGFNELGSSVLITGQKQLGGIVPHLTIASILALVWFTFGRLDVSTTVVLVMIGGIVSVLAGAMLLYRTVRIHIPAGTSSASTASDKMLPTAAPILVSTLMTVVGSQSFIWILAAYTSASSVAVFSAARRIILLVSTTLAIVNFVIAPTVAELYAKNELVRMESILRKTATIAGIPAVLVFVGLLAFGGDVLNLVYGDFYRSGAAILTILTLGTIVQVLTGSCGIVLNMTGHQTSLMIVMIVTTVVTVFAAILAAQLYGVSGVAVVMSAGLAGQNLIQMLLAKHLVGVWTFVGFKSLGDNLN